MFNMLRCIIVVVHADGVVHPKERECFNKILTAIDRTYALTDQHRRTLAEDFDAPQRLDDLLPHITDPEFRGLLLFFGEIMAWSDGSLPPAEIGILEELNTTLTTGAGTVNAMAAIRQAIAKQQQRRNSDQQPRSHISYALEALLHRMGVDPLD